MDWCIASGPQSPGANADASKKSFDRPPSFRREKRSSFCPGWKRNSLVVAKDDLAAPTSRGGAPSGSIRRALIVGSSGQDGRILFDRLAADGCAVLALARGSARSTESNEATPVDVGYRHEVLRAVEQWRPDEIYYLAAVHQASEDALVADDASLFERSLEAHV